MLRRTIVGQVHHVGRVVEPEDEEALRCFKNLQIRIDPGYSSDTRKLLEGYLCNHISCYLVLESYLIGDSQEHQLYHGFHHSLNIRLVLSFVVLEKVTHKILFQDSKTHTCFCTLKNKIFLINFKIKS